MYKTNAHLIVPFEGEMTPRQEKYEQMHRRLRARVEHFFGVIDRHRCMHYNLHETAFIDAQFNFVMHMECMRFANGEEERYGVKYDKEVARQWEELPSCDCKWESDVGKPENRASHIHREELADIFFNGNYENIWCKGASKRRKGKSAIYPSATKKEQRAKFAAKKEVWQEEQDKEKAIIRAPRLAALKDAKATKLKEARDAKNAEVATAKAEKAKKAKKAKEAAAKQKQKDAAHAKRLREDERDRKKIENFKGDDRKYY